jgi:chromosome segregation ATPase
LRAAELERKTQEEKLKEERQNLTAKNEALQAELDFTRNQLAAKKTQIEELQDELVQVQLKLQSELHRREGGLESVSSQGDSSPVEMGTNQLELVQQFHAVPDSLLLKGSGLETQKMSDATCTSPGDQQPPSFISESDSDMEEDEAEKLAERVLHLEADLRRSEETIQSLQQELAITKLAQTPTTDTHRYQLGVGLRGHGSAGHDHEGQGSLSGQPKSVEEVAVIVTETSVAKGQVEIVRTSLVESQIQLRTLQSELAVESKKTQALQETITTLNGQLNLCYAELQSKQEEVKAMKRGALKVPVNYEHEEGDSLRIQNEGLQREVDRLHQELQTRRGSGGTPTTPHFLVRPGSPTAEDQKVKLLTFIALVSIGVALASWLA